MKYILIALTSLISCGCNVTGMGLTDLNGNTTPSTNPSIKASATTTIAPDYRFVVSGAGVTFSADLNQYALPNGAGAQVETMHPLIVLGAASVQYDLTGQSMLANFTLNSGAGTLTILTYKKGVLLRTDTITTNATDIAISDTN